MPSLIKIEDRQTGWEYRFDNNTTYFMSNFTNNTISLITLPGVDSGFDPYVNERGATAKGSIQARVMLTAPQGGSYQERQRALNDELLVLTRIADMGLLRVFVQFDGDSAAYYNDCKLQNVTLPQSAKSYDDLFVEPGLFFTTENPVWRKVSLGSTSAPIYGGGFTYGGGARYGSTSPSFASSGLSTEGIVNYGGNATTPCKVQIACGASETITTVRVRRIVRGTVRDEISYLGALGNNDVLDINCVARTLRLNGASSYSTTNFDYLHPDWFRLAPGENTIRIVLGGASDACTVKFSYEEVYRR